MERLNDKDRIDLCTPGSTVPEDSVDEPTIDLVEDSVDLRTPPSIPQMSVSRYVKGAGLVSMPTHIPE